MANKKELKKIEKKSEVSESKKSEVKEKSVRVKKSEAVVNGKDLSISTKHAVAICNFIRNKKIDRAIAILEEVLQMKKAVPMKGEIPHRKGIMSGRYPIKAAKEFIRLLKSLRANAIYNGMELEESKIACKANIASRPYRRFGQKRFKRTHVEIKLIPIKNG